MLGFSGITGVDAITNQPTKIDGSDNSNYNIYNNIKFNSSTPALYSINNDPGHEFIDVFKQICGPDAKYDSKSGGYDAKDIVKTNSGFVWDYINSPSENEGHAKTDFGTVIQAYDTKNQLPIMYSLASEFVVCDRWFSSIPGPTFPNRLFFHGASSSGLDDSPTDLQIDTWNTIDGLKFDNSSIYDRLTKNNIPWHIYSGTRGLLVGSIPQAASLHNITIDKWSHLDDFETDISDDYPYFYTFIEPNYGDTVSGTFKGGTSQHPTDDVRNGEILIKYIYETIRNSKIWESSVLLITYDEHGGFYDHVIPPTTVAPGDTNKYSINNFDFRQLGIRVPSIIISPLINKNIIDHTIYDHTSILSTLEKLCNIEPLTQRDTNANNFLHLFNTTARTDTPEKLTEVNKDDSKDDNKDDKISDVLSNKYNEFVFILKKIQNELKIVDSYIGTDIESMKKYFSNIINKAENKRNNINVSGCKCVIV